MFVIKATLKDETRRLSFEGVKFPPYNEVQSKVSISLLVETGLYGGQGRPSIQCDTIAQVATR